MSETQVDPVAETAKEPSNGDSGKSPENGMCSNENTVMNETN